VLEEEMPLDEFAEWEVIFREEAKERERLKQQSTSTTRRRTARRRFR
jgi:hypothetical protein